MNLLAHLLIVSHALLAPAPWFTDFDQASKEASQFHKMILLNFSGSDWCGPCIQMKKEIFDTAVFEEYAEKKLVLVNIDFPRIKKHQLSQDRIKKNEALASQYNPQGRFPYTILMNAEGKVLKQWIGFSPGGPKNFVVEINRILNANP